MREIRVTCDARHTYVGVVCYKKGQRWTNGLMVVLSLHSELSSLAPSCLYTFLNWAKVENLNCKSDCWLLPSTTTTTWAGGGGNPGTTSLLYETCSTHSTGRCSKCFLFMLWKDLSNVAVTWEEKKHLNNISFSVCNVCSKVITASSSPTKSEQEQEEGQ